MSQSKESLTGASDYDRYREAMKGYNPNSILESMDFMIAHFNNDVANVLINAFGHSRFDPVKMRRHVFRTVRNIDDIALLVTISIMRGANYVRMLKNMKDSDLKTKLVNLIKLLKIKPRVESDEEVITLPRIAACFPELVCTLMDRTDLQGAVSIENVKSMTGCEHFPRVAMHHAVMCVIPTGISDANFTNIVSVVMVPYLMLSELINSKNSEWKKKEPREKFSITYNYLLSSFHSALVDEDQRVMACEKYGIFSKSSLTLSSDWVASESRCKMYLTNMYNVDTERDLGK